MQFNPKSAQRAEGVWLYLSFETGDVVRVDAEGYEAADPNQRAAFQVSYAGSKFDAAEDRLRKPHLKQIRKGTLASQVEKEIAATALAQTCVRDVRDVYLTDDNDQPVKVTAEDSHALKTIFLSWEPLAVEILVFAKTPSNFEEGQALVAAEQQAGIVEWHRFLMEFGDNAGRLIDLYLETDSDVPDVEDLPVLDAVDQRWMDWYSDLSSLRPQGMGASAIPLDTILDYCRIVLEYPDPQYFCRVILGIEREVLKEAAAQTKRKLSK